MDDEQASAFILDNYGPSVHSLYASFPLGVMRADFWRYAILYANGGIYSDIDTMCVTPADQWFPPRQPKSEDPIFVSNPTSWTPLKPGALDYFKLGWEDCALVAALENDVHMCQWVSVLTMASPIRGRHEPYHDATSMGTHVIITSTHLLGYLSLHP